MLRRYIISYAIASLISLAAVAHVQAQMGRVPSSLWNGLQSYAMESPLMSPLVHRVVLIVG